MLKGYTGLLVQDKDVYLTEYTGLQDKKFLQDKLVLSTG